MKINCRVSRQLNYDTPSGGGSFDITESEYEKYKNDLDGLLELKFKVPIKVYHQWLTNHGATQCQQILKSGRRCGNMTTRIHCYGTPKAYADADALLNLCHKHA